MSNIFCLRVVLPLEFVGRKAGMFAKDITKAGGVCESDQSSHVADAFGRFLEKFLRRIDAQRRHIAHDSRALRLPENAVEME